MISLNQIQIASPCQASWAEMAGTEQARFCLGCHKNVYNLSAMSHDEAQALVSGMEGQLCVRFYRRADGTMLTRDCPVGQRAVRFRLAKKRSYAAALLLACAAGLLPGAANAAAARHVLRARVKPRTTSKHISQSQSIITQSQSIKAKPRVFVLGGAPPLMPLPPPTPPSPSGQPLMGGITAEAAASMRAPVKPAHAKP